jgi:hypothetical protein
MNTSRLRPLIAASPVLASLAACVVAVLSGAWVAAVLAGAAAGLWIAIFLQGHRRKSSGIEALVERAAKEAETGRKLAIYERTTGLLAYWYVAVRCNEECERAARYKRPMVFLVVEPSPGKDDWATQGALTEWLRNGLRVIDIVGYCGNGRFIALMPETERTAAQGVIERLRAQVPAADTAMAGFPEDGSNFDELYASALQKLRGLSESAA